MKDNVINTQQIERVQAIVNNNFIIGNAALDIGVNQSSLAQSITTINKNSKVPLFIFGKGSHNKRGSIIGLTDHGKQFLEFGNKLIEIINYKEST